MKSEEYKQRAEEAKTCNNCLEWHKYCGAECCKTVVLNISPKELERAKNYIIIRNVLNYDMMWYYKLHGVRYTHGMLFFNKKFCVPRGGKVLYIRNCDMLTENLLCKGHPDKKPRVCIDLDEGSLARNEKAYSVTSNCLFRHKNEEVENNDGKEKI